MLEDAARIRRVVLACGRVELRKGIDGLGMIIGSKYNQNPFEKGNPVPLLWKAVQSYEGITMDG
jgi:hypothetical protein